MQNLRTLRAFFEPQFPHLQNGSGVTCFVSLLLLL